MPTLWLTGTAVASRTETALLTGTATVSATPSPLIIGTATVDRTVLTAWGAQIRRTATRVYLGEDAEDLLRVQGDVSVDEQANSPVATASFTLSDPRCAYHATDSIATGGLPVAIRCRVSTALAEADTTVFRGLTEASQNGGAYVPTATIQCAGDGEEWLEEKGCLSLAAFAGYDRLDILKAFAESVGIDPARITGGDGSAEVYQALDLSGLSTWELVRRFAELEDWYVRNDGTGLEILDAEDVVGSDAAPVYAFEPSKYFAVTETPPSRPVTRLVLSTVGIPEEILTGGTEETTAEIVGGTLADGTAWETTTQTTTVNGVVIRQRVEEWRDAAIPGVTPSDVAWRLWKLTETETTWGTVTVNGISLRTARIDEQRTTVTEWYSAPCRSASGYVWSDGTRHLDNAATWQVTDDRITTYTYAAAPSCLLESKAVNVGGWYSEIVASGQVYDDGYERADNSYAWIAADAAQPYQRITETYSEETGATANAVQSAIVTSRWYTPAGLAVETWGEAEGSTTRWSTVPGSGVIVEATSEFFDDGSTKYASKSYAGTLPGLTRAAADIPQYRTVPLVLTATADSDSPATSPHTETIWGAESMADLVTVARRRFRDAQSPRVTISHPALPLLRLLDVVTVTDPTRELDEAQGYVESIRLTLNASNTGALRQETTVVLPLPQFAPEVPL